MVSKIAKIFVFLTIVIGGLSVGYVFGYIHHHIEEKEKFIHDSIVAQISYCSEGFYGTYRFYGRDKPLHFILVNDTGNEIDCFGLNRATFNVCASRYLYGLNNDPHVCGELLSDSKSNRRIPYFD